MYGTDFGAMFSERRGDLLREAENDRRRAGLKRGRTKKESDQKFRKEKSGDERGGYKSADGVSARAS